MAVTRIVFLLLPDLHLLDLAGADQVFLEAIEYGANIELSYCAIQTNTVTSTSLPFGRLEHFSKVELHSGDFLMIPGARVSYILSSIFTAQKELFDWLNQSYQQGAYLCSICTGAFVLALSGLLDGKKCTTHWKRTAELQAKFPKALVQENILFTQEERIFTSAGVTAGIDMALHIVSQLKDDLFSYKIARELVVYMRRKGNESQQSVFLQYRNHIHVGVHRVQDWLQEHINQKTNLEELAEIACMSSRNLTRVFKRETSLSIHDFITLLRKEKINELLKNPDLTRLQIAQKVGLQSERQLMRLIK